MTDARARQAPSGEAEPPTLLLVGPFDDDGAGPEAPVPRVLPCPSGAAALRAAADPGIGPAIEAVCCADQLVDMTGTGLLDRIAAVLPGASRILLVPAEDGGEAAAAPASMLVTDVWTVPDRTAEVAARFVRERRALARMLDLQAELGQLASALDELRDRYTEARRARDRLVDSVGAADGGSPWWRDFRELTQLRETGCPVHRRPIAPATLEAELDRAGALRPERGPAADGPVRADPALLRRILERLCAGMRHHACPDRTPLARWHPESGALVLELSVRLARACEASALLDPLARLDGGPVAGAPIDLALAAAEAAVHGSDLQLRVLGRELVAQLRLERAPAPAERDERGSAPVVRALDRTL